MSETPPELVVEAGSVWTGLRSARSTNAWRDAAVPDGVRQYERLVITEYNGSQPDCAAVHVDRKVRPECASHSVAPRLWSDPKLAARGITGTGAPGWSTASSSRPVCCSVQAAATRFVRGTVTPASSGGRAVSAASRVRTPAPLIMSAWRNRRAARASRSSSAAVPAVVPGWIRRRSGARPARRTRQGRRGRGSDRIAAT